MPAGTGHSWRSLERRLPQLLVLGSVCYIQLHSQMHLSGPCCWQSGGLLCSALGLCPAVQVAQGLPSACPKQHLIIVGLSSHEAQSHFHPLCPFMGVLLINSNSRGNIKPAILPLGPFACLSDFFPDCYPDINSFSNLVFMVQK